MALSEARLVIPRIRTLWASQVRFSSTNQAAPSPSPSPLDELATSSLETGIPQSEAIRTFDPLKLAEQRDEQLPSSR